MPPFSTTSSRWAALQSRDPAAASAFIYSVITTKIYCRPTCPSRLARHANVVFHDNSFDAEADGFRPCKRCHPQVTENNGDPQRFAVAKACNLLKEDLQTGVKRPVKVLAAKVGLTESHFCRVFKKVMGITIGEYKRQLVSTIQDLNKDTMAGRTSESSNSPNYVMAQDEFVFMPKLDDFTSVVPLFTPDLLHNEQSTFAADLPHCDDIFDFVDFGDSLY
jgi:methylphosphotriester-DNA--protein-cysteine methyltransferase